MSLINQMLKDIDKRESGHQPKGRSASRYESGKRPWPAWVFMLFGIVVTALVLLLVLTFWRVLNQANTAPIGTREAPEVVATVAIQTPAEPIQTEPVKKIVPQAVLSPTVNTQPSAKAQQPQREPELESQVQAQPEPEPQVVAPQPAGEMSIQPSRMSPREQAERRFQQALADLQAGRARAGAQRLQEALLIAPDYHEVRQQLAVYYFSSGFLTDALAVLEQGLDEFPGEPSLILVQARILERAGEPTMALNVLREVPNDLPLNTDLLVLRAALASELGEHSLASATYESLTSWRPREGRWWVGLALAQEQLNLSEQALQAYRRALDDPSIATSTREYIHQRIEELQ